mgnify:CR=1 FL=1
MWNVTNYFMRGNSMDLDLHICKLFANYTHEMNNINNCITWWIEEGDWANRGCFGKCLVWNKDIGIGSYAEMGKENITFAFLQAFPPSVTNVFHTHATEVCFSRCCDTNFRWYYMQVTLLAMSIRTHQCHRETLIVIVVIANFKPLISTKIKTWHEFFLRWMESKRGIDAIFVYKHVLYL